jgi:hypothetical protein
MAVNHEGREGHEEDAKGRPFDKLRVNPSTLLRINETRNPNVEIRNAGLTTGRARAACVLVWKLASGEAGDNCIINGPDPNAPDSVLVH